MYFIIPGIKLKKISSPVADVVVPSNPASLLAPANTQHLTLQDVMRLPCWLPPLFVLSRKQEIHSRAESRAAEPPSPAPRRNTTSHACPFNLQAAHGVAISPHLPLRNSNVVFFSTLARQLRAHVANYTNKQKTARVSPLFTACG